MYRRCWASGMPDFEGQEREYNNVRFVRAILNNDPDYQGSSGKGLEEIFEMIRNGGLQLDQPAVYPLKDAATAHADLGARNTTGSIILRP